MGANRIKKSSMCHAYLLCSALGKCDSKLITLLTSSRRIRRSYYRFISTNKKIRTKLGHFSQSSKISTISIERSNSIDNDKYDISPNSGLKTPFCETPNHVSLPQPIAVEKISLSYLRENIPTLAKPLLEWLSTGIDTDESILDPQLKLFFSKATEYAESHGLLLGDLYPTELIRHINSISNLKDLFSLPFINDQRKLLYGSNSLPILIGSAKFSRFLQLKRQILIEKLTHLDSIDRAHQNAFNLISVNKALDVKSLSNLCSKWISDMSSFITNCINKEEGGNIFMGGSKYRLVKEICQNIDLDYLSQVTINIVLQNICIPTYHLTTNYYKKPNRYIPKSNQTLVTNTCLKIGEEIINKYSSATNVEYNIKSEALANMGGFFLYALVKNARVKVPLESARTQLKAELERYSALFQSKLDKGSIGYDELLSTLNDSIESSNAEYLDKLNALSKKFKSKFPGIPQQWILSATHNDGYVYISVFTHSLERFQGKTFGIISIRDCCWSQIKDIIANSIFTHSHLPMVIEPKPWAKFRNGASYFSKTTFIRTPIGSRFDYSSFDFSRIYKIVNAISRVPWKINKVMLNLISMAWNSSSANFNLWPHLPIKAKISLLNDSSPLPEDPQLYTKDPKIVELQNARIASETPLLHRRLNIAQEFSSCTEIYFPHNLDFRGRLYPMSSHLNHMGDDLCRSLLLFADAKPLGERGLFWLKVHIANLFGHDKIEFQRRLDWVEDNIMNFELLMKTFNPTLTDLPRKLLDTDIWNFWISADDPWQAYFAIYELLNALKLNDPTEYVTSIPIQQDGSCNGLQHYAALGRDFNGGQSVNLTPSNSPQDVYTAVLHAVTEKVEHDFTSKSEKYDIANRCFELGLLKRKVVKQTVMTICYGVTKTGAEEQIKRQLLELYPTQMDTEEIIRLSRYIADKILSSINKVFKEAMKIKKWLDKISSAFNKLNLPINWVTPIGLPCHQPYSKYTKTHVLSPLQCLNISTPDFSMPDKQKQRLAFPPNFVHSLDATHLMMTAESLLINKKNLSNFAAVHDSYWTLPCDVDYMNIAIREQFVALYNQPVLANLHQFCIDRLGHLADGLIPPPPETGTLDINLVTKSKYFFH